jgi:hypothetical protein
MNVYGPFGRAAFFVCLVLTIVLSAPSLSAQALSGQKTTGSKAGTSKAGTGKAVAQCTAEKPNFTEAQCATWIKRSNFVRDTKCPDSDSLVACTSFREMIKAEDADLMTDLATQAHVYACFRPGFDTFAEIFFSDPATGIWDKDPDLAGIASHPGFATINYYKAGIKAPQMSFQNKGKWTYGPVAPGVSFVSLHVPSSSALFKGDNIRIEGSRLEATETYKSSDGVDTTHTFILQLSTGRFSESYQILAPDKTGYAGRCFVLPPEAD